VLKLGQLDILVNNAGVQPVSSLMNMTAAELNDVLSTNIAAPVLLTRLFAAMQKDNTVDAERNACITNIASIEGLMCIHALHNMASNHIVVPYSPLG